MRRFLSDVQCLILLDLPVCYSNQSLKEIMVAARNIMLEIFEGLPSKSSNSLHSILLVFSFIFFFIPISLLLFLLLLLVLLAVPVHLLLLLLLLLAVLRQGRQKKGTALKRGKAFNKNLDLSCNLQQIRHINFNVLTHKHKHGCNYHLNNFTEITINLLT